jgi:hypothetical protein
MVPGSREHTVHAAKWFFSVFLIAGACWLAGSAGAEEGGSGHYLPGSMSSFVDGIPLKEAFVVRANVVSYNGNINASRPLPIGGRITLGADATSWGYALSLLWRPPVEIGRDWSYAVSATIPYMVLDVNANVEAVAGNVSSAVSRSSSTSGLGDIVLMPLMLNYNVHPDFNANFRLGIYAPTGDYKVGRLTNTGKNFWTFEPTIGLMYFGQKNGFEASVFFGADFNTENEDTDYQSGTQAHIDGTLAQHFPLLGGLAGAGVSGYYYKQVTADSGDGATLGDFKGKTVGLGPVVSYATKILERDALFELKWLHEVETENRLKGDIIWFKAVYKF